MYFPNYLLKSLQIYDNLKIFWKHSHMHQQTSSHIYYCYFCFRLFFLCFTTTKSFVRRFVYFCMKWYKNLKAKNLSHVTLQVSVLFSLDEGFLPPQMCFYRQWSWQYSFKNCLWTRHFNLMLWIVSTWMVQ